MTDSVVADLRFFRNITSGLVMGTMSQPNAGLKECDGTIYILATKFD